MFVTSLAFGLITRAQDLRERLTGPRCASALALRATPDDALWGSRFLARAGQRRLNGSAIVQAALPSNLGEHLRQLDFAERVLAALVENAGPPFASLEVERSYWPFEMIEQRGPGDAARAALYVSHVEFPDRGGAPVAGEFLVRLRPDRVQQTKFLEGVIRRAAGERRPLRGVRLVRPTELLVLIDAGDSAGARLALALDLMAEINQRLAHLPGALATGGS